MSKQEYIVTVKREHWAAMPDNWMHAVKEMDGVEVLSEDERFRMLRIRAEDAAIEKLRKEFTDWLHVEERSEHETRE